MQALAILAGVLIAAGGWIANGILARRALRRQMRIEYLVSAYRRLDAASNRPLDQAHSASIESALSDIQLLGSSKQVGLVDDFAHEFASSRGADTTRVLDELRATLRKELLLDDVGPRRTWLRISDDDQWAEVSASIRSSAPEAGAAKALPDEQRSAQRLASLASHDGVLAVVEAYSTVESFLRTALGEAEPNAEFIAAGELAQRAVERGLIKPQTAKSIEGLSVMRNLAVHRPSGVSPPEAAEFLALSDGVLYAVKHELSEHH